MRISIPFVSAIFQGGHSCGGLAQAVAEFRQKVLIAFQEAQDAFTVTRLLDAGGWTVSETEVSVR